MRRGEGEEGDTEVLTWLLSGSDEGAMNREGEAGWWRKCRQETNEFNVGSADTQGEMFSSRLEVRCGTPVEVWTWKLA